MPQAIAAPPATAVEITSFGYGHAAPPEADIVLDARRRFRNPHADPAMRELTGLQEVVRLHVLATPGVAAVVGRTAQLAAELTATTAATAVPDLVVVLQREGDAARAELARIDTKAAALMGWAGTAVAILAAAAGVMRLPVLPMLTVGAGAALLAAAVAVLLRVIRPNLPTPGTGYGFVRHAAGDGAALLTTLGGGQVLTERLADEVVGLSQLALTKYRALRRAVDLLLAALGCLVAALPLGALS